MAWDQPLLNEDHAVNHRALQLRLITHLAHHRVAGSIDQIDDRRIFVRHYVELKLNLD